MTDSEENHLLNAALSYADRGKAVFPLRKQAKPPLTENGCKDATTDTGQIREWWSTYPSANIGMATGQTFAVDLDLPDGPESWRSLTEDKDVPPTTQVKTPSGGRHLYFEAPPNVQIKNSVSTLGDGVDVRGHGGYVIVPPSVIDDTPYTFSVRKEVAEAPFWLLSEVVKQSRNADAELVGSDVEKAPDTIREGERNDKLTSLAGYLRHKGMTESELEQMLQVLNESRCSPPLPEREVTKIAESVGSYDPADATVRTMNGRQEEPPEEYEEMARRLCASLYENPEHGPTVLAAVPDAEALPEPFGKILAEMTDHGLGEGDLDRARVDTHLSDLKAFEEVRKPSDFDPAQVNGDPSTLIDWSEALQAQHTNGKLARDLRTFAEEIAFSDNPPGENVAKAIERIRSRAEAEGTGMVPIKEAAKQALLTVQQWKAGETPEYLRTWPSVDDRIEGFAKGEMAVVGGFTSGFKTASLVDLMKRVALRYDEIAIPIFSAEMSAEKLTRRAAANLANVSQSDLRPDRDGNVSASKEQFRRYEAALDRLSGLDIRIDEHPAPSFERMLSHCLQVQTEIGFVGFDYLEKMQMEGESEVLRVSNIARKLSSLAKRLGVPVVVLSQYSRQQQAHTQLPQNYYLRFSGKIEQEAETILHWFYPRYFVQRGADPGEVARYDPQEKFAIHAVCGKQRDGQPNDAKLWINECTGRFIDQYDEEDHHEMTPSEEVELDDEVPF